MAEVPSRGATGRDPKGIYNPRQGRAVADTSRSGQYRAAPVRQHSIDEIGYIPYGNVYERQGEHPTERAPSGGLYERPVEVSNPLVDSFIISLTYPPLVVDSMVSDLLLTGGTITPIPIDYMETGLEITSGTLNSPLKTYTWPTESIDTDLTIDSGSLVTALLSYTWPAESMDTDLTLNNGSLVAALIRYNNWIPENMETDLLITGGTLV